MSIPISIVVAVAENGVIGLNNEMPWHLPEDLKHFKRVTMGKPIVMGRKTFESIGRPLPGRHNIVISRGVRCAEDVGTDSVETLSFAGTVDEALESATKIAGDAGAEEVMVIGGAEIYRQTLPLVTRVYRTLVAIEPDGDSYFPDLDCEWELMAETCPNNDEPNCKFQILEKRFKKVLSSRKSHF